MNTREIQTALYRLGFDPRGVDGVDGPHTRAAIAAFVATVSDPDLEHALGNALQSLPLFIPAKNFTPAARKLVDVIVVHTAEAPEIHNEARNVAGWFAQQPRDGSLDPVTGHRFGGTSAHYVVDDRETIQCVLECDEAWAAPGANGNGVHIEHAGYASQDAPAWDDEYSRNVLERSARLAGNLVRRFSIPIRRLSVDELRAHARGFVGHVDVTHAFSNGVGHLDPGPAFPWDRYLELVRAAAGAP